MTEAAAPAATPEVPPQQQVSSATPPVDTPAPERTFSQKELDEIVEKRLAKERRKRDELRQERDVLRKLALERGGEPAAKPAEPKEGAEPTRGDYASYEEYLEARTTYRAGKTAEETITKREKAAEEKRAQEARVKEAETFRARERENAKGIDDYDDVVGAAIADPSSAVARLEFEPISTSDNPAKILHHLATHPEEAERIASLPRGQQAREIWKLDASLATATKPAPAKPSAAPAPISPVGGGKTTPAGEMPDPITQQKEWIAWRNAQVRFKRTGKTA